VFGRWKLSVFRIGVEPVDDSVGVNEEELNKFIGEHMPADDFDDVVVVIDDETGEDDADDEVENNSLSFISLGGALTSSSLAAARVSASIGFAFASMSLEEFSEVLLTSEEDDSFGQLSVSCRVVESG